MTLSLAINHEVQLIMKISTTVSFDTSTAMVKKLTCCYDPAEVDVLRSCCKFASGAMYRRFWLTGLFV